VRIAIFGASGRIGGAVAREAVARGHDVVAISRHTGERTPADRLQWRSARVDHADEVAAAVQDCDVVVNAVSGLGHDDIRISVDCLEPLVQGMRSASCRRLIVVGTAGTLRVAGGLLRMDADGFPPFLRDEANAHRDLQAKLRAMSVDEVSWTYFSPPALIDDGERTGEVILGLDDLLYGSAGRSFISNDDYAMALIDEAEQPRFVRMRFTAVGR
jgi:putative NADH-flavin reductase